MFYKEIWEQAQPGSAFLEHLETQDLKISAKHGGGKGEGELQDVTGPSKKTLDTLLILVQLLMIKGWQVLAVIYYHKGGHPRCGRVPGSTDIFFKMNIWRRVATSSSHIFQNL